MAAGERRQMEDGVEARAAARLGTILGGKYRLDRVLGIGGMATVYKATHRNQAEFAIKVLFPELSIRSEIRARFLREGYAANSVKHPGSVVVVDDAVADDGSAFLVMELLDGLSVEALWEAHHRRLPADAVVAIGVQLLDVLAAAHARAIVHRDVKPANLFVTKDGLLKVLDFGIARVRDAAAGAGAQTTGAGVLLGTPSFMAPEQAIGRAEDVDAQADVWSAGATLFTLLSGGFVHDAATPNHVLVKAATTPARSVAEVAPGTPPPLVAAIDRALAFTKEARWPSADAMRDALSAIDGEPHRGRARLAALVAGSASGASTFGAQPTTPAIGLGGDLTRFGATALSGPPPGLVGGTTAAPMSRNTPPERRTSRAVSIAMAVALAIGFLGAVLIVAAVRSRALRTDVHAIAAPSDTVSVTAPDTAPPPPAVTIPPPAERPETSASAPAASVAASAARPRAAATPSPPPSAKRVDKKPDCTSPFTIDAEGNKVFKKECL
jgi:serine/threonine-protein kinase